MEKYDFIKMMLQSRNLSVNDKKRLVLLATKELDESQLENTDKERLDSNNNEKSSKDPRYALLSNGVRYINPQNLREFLLRYNQNQILKYTCHDIDSTEVIDKICKLCGTQQYDYLSHVKLIENEYKKLNDALKADGIYKDSKMYQLFNVYISGGGVWSNNNISICWNSDAIKTWATANPGIIPSPGPNIKVKQGSSGYRLPKPFLSNITGTRVMTFRDLVIFLKSLFHIRTDNSLRSMIEYRNKTKLSEYDITFKENSFGGDIALFTNVEKLLQAYEYIIKDCSSYNQEPARFELSFFEDNTCPTFVIHHVNSVYRKTLSDTLSRIGEFQSRLIENQINGICDLYIEADFSNNQYARINLWDSKPMKKEEIEPVEGVKYILKFPSK